MSDLRIQFDVYEKESRFWEENREWSGDCGIEDIEKIEPIKYSDRYRIIFKTGFIPDDYETIINREELDKVIEVIEENTEIIDWEILKDIDWEKNGTARMEDAFEQLRKQFSS